MGLPVVSVAAGGLPIVESTIGGTKRLPSVEYLRECFDYDPITGVLSWKTRPREHFPTVRAWNTWNSKFGGKAAGWLHVTDRRYVTIGRHDYLVHRIAWAIYHGKWPTQFLDHINRDPADNRMVNLRQVTNGQNRANSQSNTVGRPKGVYWNKARQRWVSSIRTNGRKRHLGYFDAAADAAAAFERASREIYGEFACVEAR